MGTTQHRKAILIVNGMSRKGQQAFDTVCQHFASRNFPLNQSLCIRDPDDFGPAIDRALDDGADLVIVGGGDGSIASAVDHFTGREAHLGVLPLGTANSFARSLGLPLNLEGAADTIIDGSPRLIDLGMIDDDYFASCAAIGMSPLIAESVPHRLKAVLGRLGYMIWAAYQFLRFRPFTLIVGEGDSAERVEALEVRIANGPFHGGHELVESADLDSGEIVVQVVEGRTKGRLALSWLFSVLHLPAKDATTREFHGRALKIATDPPLPISIDGEVSARTPVVVKVAPKAVRVMAGAHPLPSS